MSAKPCKKRYAVHEVNHRFDIVDPFFYIARIRAGLVLPGRRECQGNPGPLADLFRAANLQAVDVRSLDVPTAFVDFNDYWSPFLRGQGPAGAYCVSLSEDDREHLRKHLENTVPVRSDGSIHLIARAWGVRGIIPTQEA